MFCIAHIDTDRFTEKFHPLSGESIDVVFLPKLNQRFPFAGLYNRQATCLDVAVGIEKAMGGCLNNLVIIEEGIASTGCD